MKKVNKVVGAVIFDPQKNSFFIGQRSRFKTLPLKWEFIGGKIESGEDSFKAVEREFAEEIGQKIKAVELIHTTTYDYGRDVGTFEVSFIKCQKFKGKPKLDKKIYEVCKWVTREKLSTLDWLEADKEFVVRLGNLSFDCAQVFDSEG